MTRTLDATTKTALAAKELPLAAIVYLDILGDNLKAWTGIGDLVFGAGATGDPSLDGNTFEGIAAVMEISEVTEGAGGSDALEIALPGVDLALPALRQLITNRNRWQFRRAVVWLMALDPTTYAIAGKPFRIKTGRMDRMPLSENNNEGVVKCVIEGQQSYGDIPLGSRYSEQIDINPNDTSQKWVHSLANMNAVIGKNSAAFISAGAGGIPGGFDGFTWRGGIDF